MRVCYESNSDALFSPDSVTRKIYSQTAVVLGWPRAILMQLAHPLVAAGVAQHSGYQVEPVQRFLHTFDAALQIIFGTGEQARRTVERINEIHRRVHGELPESVGAWPAGTPYRAGDSGLLLWVHCTLVDSDLVAYERFVGPLSRDEKERCYQERKVGGPPLGLMQESMPGSLAAMQDYLAGELASDRIAVGDFQRGLAEALLYPDIKHVPKRSFEPLVALTADLLPEKLRLGYRLEMTPGRKAVSRLITSVTRRTLPLMPGPVKHYPASRAKGIVQGTGVG